MRGPCVCRCSCWRWRRRTSCNAAPRGSRAKASGGWTRRTGCRTRGPAGGATSATAEAALDALDTLWQKHQGYLHIVISHTELDEAEALLAQARAAVRQGICHPCIPSWRSCEVSLNCWQRRSGELEEYSLK